VQLTPLHFKELRDDFVWICVLLVVSLGKNLTLLLLRPWLWSDDLDIRTWSAAHSGDVPAR